MRHVMVKLLRAHHDVGFFYITGHRISDRLFTLVRDAIGQLPYTDVPDAEADTRGKEKLLIAQFRANQLSIDAPTKMKRYQNWEGIIKDYHGRCLAWQRICSPSWPSDSNTYR